MAHTIVLVEDESLTRRAFALALRAAGFETVEAADAFACRAALKKARADVVILDLGLPGIDGMQLAGELRKEDSDLCLIVVSRQQAPEAAIKQTIRRLFPSTDVVKVSVKFNKIQVGPARLAHTAEVYGIPGGTTYWNILAQYTTFARNNFDPAHPTCRAQNISQLYIAHKSDFGDWSISQVSGSENHSDDEKSVPCQ